jgi:hypothetical protein
MVGKLLLTNNNARDDSPVVDSQGHVWWLRIPNEYDKYLYYYNGNSSIQIANIGKSWQGSSKEPNITFEGQGKTVEGNCIVYSKVSKPGSYNNDYEIFLFDGQNEVQITHNNYSDINPTICNGYIVWVGYPDDTGYHTASKAEIFLYQPSPTAVSMSSLKATPSDKQVKLEWQTASEIDNAGFNVWRAEGFHKINDSMIPAEGSPIMGADYDFFDKWVMNGKLYYYLVEDVDTNGVSTFHGPVKAVPRMFYGLGR